MSLLSAATCVSDLCCKTKMAEISTEDAVEQLHQMFGDYDKAALAAVLEVCLFCVPTCACDDSLLCAES